jgi:hypothetical protein
MKNLLIQEIEQVTGGAPLGCSDSISSSQYSTLASGWNTAAAASAMIMATGVGVGLGFSFGIASLSLSAYNTYCSWY